MCLVPGGGGREWRREEGRWGRVVPMHGRHDVVVRLCSMAELELAYGSGNNVGCLRHGWNGGM